MFFVLLIYIITAYKSTGYHHEDEHYQIIEFANYKLGILPVERLAWEFNAQIRPGFQPFICFILFKSFSIIGISDGYILAFMLRALTALLSVLVIHTFVNAHLHQLIVSLRPYFIFLSYLCWFIPYISVRFSSETWSGLCFLLTMAIIRKGRFHNNSKKFIIVGLLLGSAILFRYQSGLLVAGVVLWFIIIRKISVSAFFIFSASIASVLLLGVLIDYWLYDSFTLSIYRYFYVNIVEGVSSQYGISPWYSYIVKIFASSGPFGLFILVALISMILVRPKDVLLWAVVPFLIVHSVIPHKELRFLFPIAALTPLFLLLTFQELHRFSRSNTTPHFNVQFATNAIVLLILVVNTAGLIAKATTGAGKHKTSLTEFIHRHYGEKANIIVNGDINPYIDWGPPKNSYYSSSGKNIKWISSIWKTDLGKLVKPGIPNLLIIADSDITGPKTVAFLERAHLVKTYQNIPNFVKFTYKIYDPQMLDYGMSVYEFK